MKNAIYIIIGIIIIVIIGGVGYVLVSRMQKVASTSQPAMTQSPTLAPTAATTNGSVGLTNKTDTSNQQLDQDLQNIQGSMDNLSADQTQADQAVSNQSADTPTEQ